jgi:GT2 family glycosyltransferase
MEAAGGKRSRPSLAVIVVTYNSRADVQPLLDAVVPQLAPRDELIVVDNDSSDGTAAFIRDRAPRATVRNTGRNLGFAGAANVGVQMSGTDLVLLLNPDAVPQPGCLDRLAAAAIEQPAWGCWQALVTLPGGSTINAAGGRVHFLGFGWAGAWGEPVATHTVRMPIGFASGAALCVRRELWARLGGFDPHYFMYCEDLELGLRVHSAGWDVGIVPAAIVEHGYEFDKGTQKWFYLERNRWATIIATYPGRLLILLLPALLAFELALWIVASRGGWAGAKRRATVAVLRDLRHNIRRRRRVQAERTIDVAAFAATLTAELDGAFFAAIASIRPLAWAQRAYWRAICALL